MKNSFLLLSFLFVSILSHAQQPIKIGMVINEQYVITADTSSIKKALQYTLGDGAIISHMHIESEGKWHYLLGTGTLKTYSKTIAVELIYDMSTRTFLIKPGMAHKTCASAACGHCEPFKENGNIIGCHCKQKGSVSNECNFKTVLQSPFYSKLSRLLK